MKTKNKDELIKHIEEQYTDKDFDKYIILLMNSQKPNRLKKVTNCSPIDVVQTMLGVIEYEIKNAEDKGAETAKVKEYVLDEINRIINKDGE